MLNENFKINEMKFLNENEMKQIRLYWKWMKLLSWKWKKFNEWLIFHWFPALIFTVCINTDILNNIKFTLIKFKSFSISFS